MADIDSLANAINRARPALTELGQRLWLALYRQLGKGDRLFLSDKTVRNHVSNIFAKLQVADRAEAIVRAREAGLGSEEC